MTHRYGGTALRGAIALLAMATASAHVTPATAQGAIQCSAFLHMRDGSWRSLQEADVLGPAGVTHVENGDIMRAGQKSAKGEVARALDAICQPE